MKNWRRILFAGVGGQGVLSAGRWVGDAAHACGLSVVVGQIHGLSQRGGSVHSAVAIGGARDPEIPDGMADVGETVTMGLTVRNDGWGDATGVSVSLSSSAAVAVMNGPVELGDLEPGEAIFIDTSARVFTRQCADNPVYSPCIFEFVYLARPDSIIDDVSVYKARLRMGERLADKILRALPTSEEWKTCPPNISRPCCVQ